MIAGQPWRIQVKARCSLLMSLVLVIFPGSVMAGPREDKALVARLYAEVFNGHNLQAVGHLLDPGYIQHNPSVPAGRDGFVRAFTSYFNADPTLRVDVKRVIASDGLVAVHGHWTDKDDSRGQAVVDIFRVQHNRIVEHWDVVQDVPKSVADPQVLF